MHLFKSPVFKELTKNKVLYIMTLPGILLLFLFNYLPMIGVVIAFKEFKFDMGIFGSPWSKPLLNNFMFFFTSDSAIRSIKNTLFLNFTFIAVGVVLEVGLALLINEISCKVFKKITQSFTLLPYFISWIVVSVFAYNLFNYDYGILNSYISAFGLEKIDWYSRTELWPLIMLILNKWKVTGYGTIMYLATLSGIDSTYYEAAEIDGASKLRQIFYISIPMLMPTVIILTLLQIGKIMNADFGFFYAIVGENSILYPSVDVIDTFIFRSLRKSGDVGMASAAGLFQSCISFLIVFISNWFARRIDDKSAIF